MPNDTQPRDQQEIVKSLSDQVESVVRIAINTTALGIELLSAGCPYAEQWDGNRIDEWENQRIQQLRETLWYLVWNYGWSNLRIVQSRLPDEKSRTLLAKICQGQNWETLRNKYPSASSALPLRPLR